jgi:hypothetical protein
MNLNQAKLEQVIQQAFDTAGGRGGQDARRWQSAIAKAKQQLETNPYLHFDGESLLILSDSNEIYRANGTCQCVSLTRYGRPCWHRAAYKIVKNYMSH